MNQRVLIEFVLDVPNMDVAADVEKRISQEHMAKLCEVLQSITGYQPKRTPDGPGFYLATEPVTWNASEQDWIGPDDGNDDDD